VGRPACSPPPLVPADARTTALRPPAAQPWSGVAGRGARRNRSPGLPHEPAAGRRGVQHRALTALPALGRRGGGGGAGQRGGRSPGLRLVAGVIGGAAIAWNVERYAAPSVSSRPARRALALSLLAAGRGGRGRSLRRCCGRAPARQALAPLRARGSWPQWPLTVGAHGLRSSATRNSWRGSTRRSWGGLRDATRLEPRPRAVRDPRTTLFRHDGRRPVRAPPPADRPARELREPSQREHTRPGYVLAEAGCRRGVFAGRRPSSAAWRHVPAGVSRWAVYRILPRQIDGRSFASTCGRPAAGQGSRASSTLRGAWQTVGGRASRQPRAVRHEPAGARRPRAWPGQAPCKPQQLQRVLELVRPPSGARRLPPQRLPGACPPRQSCPVGEPRRRGPASKRPVGAHDGRP